MGMTRLLARIPFAALATVDATILLGTSEGPHSESLSESSRCLLEHRTGGSLQQDTPRVSVRNTDCQQPCDRCPRDDHASSPCFLCVCVFFSATQQAISPNCSQPRFEYTVAPSRLVVVYLSLRNHCCVGKGQTGLLHFHLCGNLWCVGDKIVMFLVFSCLKLGNWVSSRKKRRSRRWTLMSVGFVHGILGGQGNRNQNCVDWKESSQGSSKKFVPPSNIVDKEGRTIPRCQHGR